MNKKYTAIELLEKVFEFIAMTPEEKDWNIKKLQSNKPRQVRLQQIEALLFAFGLFEDNEGKGMSASKSSVGNALNSLLYGDFINTLKEQHIEEIDHYVTKHFNDPYFDRELSKGELRFIYQYMIKYRKQVYTMLRFNSGRLEAGGKMVQYAIRLTSTITDNLNGKTEELDKLLDLIINPNQLSFTEQELIERFQYPDADLIDIDLDNM